MSQIHIKSTQTYTSPSSLQAQTVSQQPKPKAPLLLTDKPWQEVQQKSFDQRLGLTKQIVSPQDDFRMAIGSSKLLNKLMSQQLRIALPRVLSRQEMTPQNLLSIESPATLFETAGKREKIERLSHQVKTSIAEAFVEVVRTAGYEPYLAGGGAISIQQPDNSRPISDLDFRVEANPNMTDFQSLEGKSLMKKLNQGLHSVMNDQGSPLQPVREEVAKMLNNPELSSLLTTGEKALFEQFIRPDKQALGQFNPQGGEDAVTISNGHLLGVEVSISLNQFWPHEAPITIKGTGIPSLGPEDLLKDKLKTVLTRLKYNDDSIKKVGQDLVDVLVLADSLESFQSSLGFLKEQMQSRVSQYRTKSLETSTGPLMLRDEFLAMRMVDRLIRTIDSHIGPSADPERESKFLDLTHRLPESGSRETAQEISALKTPMSQFHQLLRKDIASENAQILKISLLTNPHDEQEKVKLFLDLGECFKRGGGLDTWFADWNRTKSIPMAVSISEMPGPPPKPLHETPIDTILNKLKGSNATPAEQILFVLKESGGFRPLGDMKPENIEKAFGLTKRKFMEGTKALGALFGPGQPLSPEKDGLHVRGGQTATQLIQADVVSFSHIQGL